MTIEKINLDDYVQSGEGFTALTYNHVNGKTMAKLFYPYIPKEIPEKEMKISQAVLDMGFTTPHPLRMITDGERIGNEYERICPKKSFARAIADSPEQLQEYAVRFAEMCRQLHSVRCSKEKFPSVVDFYHKTVKANAFLSEEDKAKVDDFIDSVPATDTCCHGDLHIGNVITSKGVDYWIDLSEFSWGNPLFDLGVLYLGGKVNTDEINLKMFHLSTSQMLEIWSIFKRVYFDVKTDMESNTIDEMTAPFAALKLLFFTVQNHTPKMLHEEFVRKALGLETH